MFSGIIETQAKLLSREPGPGCFRLRLQRPAPFTDLAEGHSLCVDGVCLTLEKFDQEGMEFTLAAETLAKTQAMDSGQSFNLERSLVYGERIHGHLVTGHVEGLAEMVGRTAQGESLFLNFRYPKSLEPWIWPKGSVALNGVSLTLNEVADQIFSVCLVPETRRRTNLEDLQMGDFVNIETDYLAKALTRARGEA